tara:strand:+ start:128 stop:733 length:606 start_codon:yes stop_codon:yes gene_type:complete
MSKTQIVTGGIADDAVSEEHLDATAITGSTELAATPADTDEILISDAGTLKRIDFSHIKYSGGKNFFSAYDPSNNVSNDTDTKIIFETESFDDASAYDTSNGRFTVPSGEGGKYFLYAKIRHYNTTSMSREVIYLYKNGSVYVRYEHKGDNVHNSIQISKVANLSAGDYIEVYYYQNSGSANNIAQFSADTDQEFSGFRIV